MPDRLTAAVVTGGHAFEVREFHELFRNLSGIDSYIQHIDDFASSPEETRASYDLVVLFILFKDGPAEEGLPWYAGRPRSAMEGLGANRQGIVLLHHAVLCWPEWPTWTEISGIPDRTVEAFDLEPMDIHVAKRDHSITEGISDWALIDEPYRMADAALGSTVLLETRHPRNARTIAWTRHHGDARVFCLQLGHGSEAWRDESFRTVLERGMCWTANRPA